MAAAAHQRSCVRGGPGKGCAPEGGGHGTAPQGSGHGPELLLLRGRSGTAVTYSVWVCVVLCLAQGWKGPPRTIGSDAGYSMILV